jgi:geranylgeranyl pyrophosphate synthase
VSRSALDILRESGARVETYLREVMARQSLAPQQLRESIEYSLLAGGKRVRPTLVLESAVACAGKANRSSLAAAGAIELIHTFSLVHDDLPAMDDDDLRRGRPTNHKVFGEPMAILAGDAMTTLAFEVIAMEADTAVAAKLIAELARASGPGGMIGGQVLDMEGEQKSLSYEELKRLHGMKTGALLTCACRMGAVSVSASDTQLSALTSFGRYLGLAFQIMDDVLDVTASPEQMGKATGKDAEKGKNTYPALLGLEQSRVEAQRQLGLGLAAIESLSKGAEGLRTLAKFVVDRQN